MSIQYDELRTLAQAVVDAERLALHHWGLTHVPKSAVAEAIAKVERQAAVQANCEAVRALAWWLLCH